MVGYDHEQNLHFSDSFVAGFLGGIVTRALVCPLDVLKIRFQLQPGKDKTQLKYTSIIQAVKTILREEGVLGFWKGHMPAQCLSMVYGGLQFSTFQYFTGVAHKIYPHKRSDHSALAISHFLCGCLSGTVASCFAQPVDVLRTRFAAQKDPVMFKSVRSLGWCMVKNEGMRGFYRGLTPALIQVAPYSGFQFAFYTMLEKVWLYSFKSKDWLGNLICGGAAGIASKSVVYPLDVVKKRLQVQGFHKATVSAVINYKGFRHCVTSIFKHEGVVGLYKGLSASVLKSGTTSGLIFCTYEFFIELLHSVRSS